MGLNLGMMTTWKVRCGIATYSENLVNALAEQGVNVYVVRVSRFGMKTPELLKNDVDKIPKDGDAPTDKIDVIHVQHEYGIYQGLEPNLYLALKSLHKPIVTTMHSTGVRTEIDDAIARSSDRVIVHNKYCLNRFGYPATVIPHGALSSKPLRSDEAKKTWGIDARTPIVGYCGFISSYKGIEQLVEAMVKVPNVALLIAGGWHVEQETEYITHLKNMSFQALPNRCQWLGFVPDEKLAAVYGAMDIVVYPSRFATESGALIMALSHGKAVLASAIAPFKEKEKAGALMTFKDIKDLTRKIKRLLQDEKLRRSLEEEAKKYVNSVSWTVVAEKHIQLYRELLNKT